MQHARRALTTSITACAILVATASIAAAALPELLPGAAGTRFTGKSGKGTLQVKGGAAVQCKTTTGEGELTSSTTGEGTTRFEGCSTAGLAVNSLGDSSGTILVTGGTTSVCYIKKSTKEVGIVTHIPTSGVHLEVPATNLLLIAKGAFIIIALPINEKTTSFTAVAEQKEGKQAVTKCEGGATEVMSVSADGGEFIQAGLETKEGSLTFETEEELMA